MGLGTSTPGALKGVIALQGQGLGQGSKRAEAAEPIRLVVQGRDGRRRVRAEEGVSPPGGLAGPLSAKFCV